MVRNYLDCGLGDFGIDLSSKIMQFEHPSKLEPESELSHPSEDEAIGDKFEPVHLVAFELAEETILKVKKEIPEAAGESEPRF